MEVSPSGIFRAWAAIAAGFSAITLAACLYLRWALTRRRRFDGPWPAIWVIRPCEGDEPGLAENLASSAAPYPGRRRILFLVPSRDDPAFTIAEAVARRLPEAELLVTEIRNVGNRKSAQLCVGLEHTRDGADPSDVIVQADSDVRLGDESLSDLVAALHDRPSSAAAYAAPVECETRTLGDFAAAGMLGSTHQDFFALAALSHVFGITPSMAGPLAAHRRRELEEERGFDGMEELLGEDFEMGRRLHARGLGVEVARLSVHLPSSGRTLGQMITRTARWTTVVRRQRGALFWTFPVLLAPTPVLLVAAGLLGDDRLWAWLGALGALRALLSYVLRRIHQRPVGLLHALGLALAGELLLLVGSLRAAVSSRVVWRGHSLVVMRGGFVASVPPTRNREARSG